MLTNAPSDLLIVGAGIIGSTIAAATSRQGRTTHLVERHSVGCGGATRASGGIVRSYHDEPSLNDRAALALRSLAPRPDKLADEAREQGALVLEGVAIQGIHVGSDNQIEVDSSLGGLRTRRLVLAAGAASADILASLEEPIAIRSKGILARHLLTSLEHTLPCAFEDRTSGLYGRPLGVRRSLVGLPTSDWDVPPDASPPLRADPEFQRVLGRRLPSYGSALSEGGRYGVDGYTDDGIGIVRRSKRAPNVIIATGFSGSGVKLAPWVAQQVVKLLDEE